MSASEAVFWYNTSIGRNFSYFFDMNSTYTPEFGATPTEDQLTQIAQVCKKADGTVDEVCKYDYLRTGSALAAQATLTSSSQLNDIRAAVGKEQYSGLRKLRLTNRITFFQGFYQVVQSTGKNFFPMIFLWKINFVV
jgi:hypothetical protein